MIDTIPATALTRVENGEPCGRQAERKTEIVRTSADHKFALEFLRLYPLQPQLLKLFVLF